MAGSYLPYCRISLKFRGLRLFFIKSASVFNRKEFPEALLRGKLLDGFILVFS